MTRFASKSRPRLGRVLSAGWLLCFGIPCLVSAVESVAPSVRVNRTVPEVEPPPLAPPFSAEPTAEEIRAARVFGEPIVTVGGAPTDIEVRSLAAAIQSFLGRSRADDEQPMRAFLSAHPQSAYRASLLLNLGLTRRRNGAVSRAREAFEEAWHLSKTATEPEGSAVAEKAIGEWAELNTLFGDVDELDRIFAEVGVRVVYGSAGQKLAIAREGRRILVHHHEFALPSSSTALNRLLARRHGPGYVPHPALAAFHATHEGASLAQLRDLATTVGAPMQVIFRESGEIPVPSIVHLNVKHFSAVVRRQGDLYLLDDPILGGETWVSAETLLDESSGYFVVPTGGMPEGSRPASEQEAAAHRGKCAPCGPDPNGPKRGDPRAGGDCGDDAKGLARWGLYKLHASLHLGDVPVGYSPPRGPLVAFRLDYNHRETHQPALFAFSNVGRLWTYDWLTYLEDDPVNAAASVTLFHSGGGVEVSVGFDAESGSYTRDIESRAQLVRTSSSPIRYERRHPNGAVDVFAQADGASSAPRRIFRTEAIDPQGQKLNFIYDASLRLAAVEDAIGQVTTLSYELSSDPLKITKVTDPFGRFASLEYDALGRLKRITDVIGLASELSYIAADFLVTLETPYGVSRFTSDATSASSPNRWVEAEDPLGGRERAEFEFSSSIVPQAEAAAPIGFAPRNNSLQMRNSFYWSKRAMALFPGDFLKSEITHWLTAADGGNAVAIPASIKLPLESRLWYSYPGQTYLERIGTHALPSQIARLLDDGQTQAHTFSFNASGYVTNEIDPLGRLSVYEYSANDIDLLRVKQYSGGTYEIVQSFTFNTAHLPATRTDASGQTTSYIYNAQGQLSTVTTPPRQGIAESRTWTYSYSADGYLEIVSGPAGAMTTFTYDGYGRRRTMTDSEAYSLTYDYDGLDRLTRTTYPDATYEETLFNRLDPEGRRDRLGRWTYAYRDALRRVVLTSDPLGNTTRQEWCACDGVDRAIDANAHETSWERDLQGRVTRETRADGAFWEITYESTTSRVKQVHDAKGQRTDYAYFLDDNVRQVSYPTAQVATPSVLYSYDPAYNRLVSTVDGSGATIYTYHPISGGPLLGAGHLAAIDGPFASDTISYGYDELGRVVSRTLAGNATSYAYDALGRVTSISEPMGTFASNYVGSTRRISSMTYPNGQVSTYSYYPTSSDSRLQEVHHRVSLGGATLSRFSYTYDAAGNIRLWTQQFQGQSRAYELTYDAADRLASASYRTTDPVPLVLARYGYAYDAAGNRTTEQINDSPMVMVHDARNRLVSQQPGGELLFRGSLSEPGFAEVAGQPADVDVDNRFEGAAAVTAGTNNVTVEARDSSGNTRVNTYEVAVAGNAATFGYDANGSLVSEGTRSFEWDGANRLVRVLEASVELVRFVYDGDGRRVQKVSGGVTRTYVYDREDIVEERQSSGATIRYVHGPLVDRPFAKFEAGAANYLLADHLGSVVQITDSSATVIESRQYDLWGNLPQGPDVSGYGFTGRERDAESDLYYYRTRYYDASRGRFLSEDPIGWLGGPNFYSYVRNSPVKYFDPFGLDAVTSDPKVRECLCKLWKDAQEGLDPMQRERSMWITKKDGVRDCIRWPWTAQRRKETWTGPIPENVEAIMHIHPLGLDPKPSPGDQDTADSVGKPNYACSREGIWRASPNCTTGPGKKKCPPTKIEEKDWPKWCEEGG